MIKVSKKWYPVIMKMYTTKDTNKHVYTAHQGGLTEEQIMAVLAEMGAN